MSAKTIAIIGATGRTGIDLALLLSGEHRLLLFDHDQKALARLVKEIQSQNPYAQIESLSCAGDASWEADVIIPNVPPGSEIQLANNIRAFVNRKIVVTLNENQVTAWENVFPAARVILLSGFSIPAMSKQNLRLSGKDADALKTISDIFLGAGYAIHQSTNKTSKTINQSKMNTMETTKWVLDPTHSELHFKVRHLMVSWVTGIFKQFDASVETEGEDLSTARVHFSADVNSISTNNDQRDAHLKTTDFFDSSNHPQIVFEGSRLEKIDGENYKLNGTLTLRGISRKLTLNVEFGGITKDPWGNTRTGFTVSGKINRKDFGVSFSMVSETGGILLGEEVTINANVEFVKQVATQTKAA